MLHARLSRPDLADPALDRSVLALRWRALARGASPFLSWPWVFGLAAERYPDPVLVETFDGPGDAAACVGLALFNRRRTRLGHSLHLHESGDPAWDSIFIEHNGVLAAPGLHQAVTAATLDRALGLASRVVLNGIGADTLAVAHGQGWLGRRQARPAPYLPLVPGGALGPSLSRNTRAQLARSDRSFGAIRVEPAGDVAQALDWLERLLALHRATWSGRGIESGFAAAPVQRFHRALIQDGLAEGLVQVLRISGDGGRVIGYLLNLCAGGRVCAYQSGFDYAAAGPHGKPGLSSHAAAIGLAAAGGATEYDFLAGDGRYKRSLTRAMRELHWVELCRPRSLAGMEALARRVLRR